MTDHTVTWHDSGREPQCAPNPEYPSGKDLVIAAGDGCLVELPYPAKRCGHYVVECSRCDARIIVTTAGRPDDPRSLKIPCGRKPS